LIEAGQIVLLRFPYADARGAKLRPALVLAPLPGPYDDWLVSMISSRLHQAVRGIDEIVLERDADFADLPGDVMPIRSRHGSAP
jgi:mRNA interferase MazF